MLVEHDDLRDADRIRHCAAEDPVLADALIHCRLEEERMIELVRLDLEPDPVVLVPDVEQALRLLRILHDVGERPGEFASCAGTAGDAAGGRRTAPVARRRSRRSRAVSAGFAASACGTVAQPDMTSGAKDPQREGHAGKMKMLHERRIS